MVAFVKIPEEHPEIKSHVWKMIPESTMRRNRKTSVEAKEQEAREGSYYLEEQE